MKTKVIFFDLGGVLFTNGSKAFVKYLVEKSGFDEEKVKDLMSGTLGNDYRVGKISREEFWNRLLSELSIDEHMDTLEARWENGYKLIKETKAIIKKLSKKYRVYFLSDNIKSRADRLQKKYKFLSLFEDGIFSHEVGVRKPHPKIYEVALAKAGVAPKESLFIDDKESSLVPARKMGMQTILFKSPEGLQEELQKLGII